MPFFDYQLSILSDLHSFVGLKLKLILHYFYAKMKGVNAFF